MDCTRRRLIRVIGLCKENVTNKQSAGIIQATIVSSMDQTGASDEWVFVHCCLVFMITTLVLSLSVYFYSRDKVSYPMTEHNRHVDYIRIQHVTHVNKGHKTPPTMCLPTYIYINFLVT